MLVPVGTQVVTRHAVVPSGGGRMHPAGAVAVVVSTPRDIMHSYRVRFVDQTEAALRREEFVTLREEQRQRAGLVTQPSLEPAARAFDDDLRNHIIFRCVVGSRAYGLDRDGSDVDRRGIYLPPAERHWSLLGVPEQLENDATQECYWEIQKFITLALKANPNVLECLFTPVVESSSPIADALRAQRSIFVSRLIYQTYNGYVLSQFRKLEQDLRNRGEIKWKHAMHLIRLLLAGITALREGVIPLEVGGHRDALLEIRAGLRSWSDVDAWRKQLHAEFDAALEQSSLPERPDYAVADAILLRARRLAAGTEK